MFNFEFDNRKMIEAGGDVINISGFTDDSKSPVSPNNPPDPNAIIDNPPPGTPPGTPPDTPPDLLEITDKTDVLLKAVISSKYDDIKVVRLNKAGDLVNTEGVVLISKADLDKSVDEVKTDRVTKADAYIKKMKTVQIGNDELKILEDGSVKDAAGNVVLTAEQLRQQVMSDDNYLKEDNFNDDVFSQIEQLTGIQLADDAGNPIEFEFTPEGLAQRDLHLIKQEGSRIAQEAINKFFSDTPELEKAYYYLKTKGTLEGFGSRTNHEGITIKYDDAQQQYDIFVEGQLKRGYTREQARSRADLFKKNDMLFEESKNELAYIIAKEKEEVENDKLTYEKLENDKLEQQRTYWSNIANKLSTGKVLDFNIPENIRVVQPNNTIKYYSRQDFMDYMSKPVKGNLTQAQVDAQSEDIDLKILYDYLRFVKHDMTYIINQKVKQNKVNDLKQRFNKDAIPSRKIVVTAANSKSNNDGIVYS